LKDINNFKKIVWIYHVNEESSKEANENANNDYLNHILEDLKEAGRLYKKEMFTHSYPHCWRHKVPLMYYATDSWFIKTTEFKEKMIEINKRINWHPEEVGSGRRSVRSAHRNTFPSENIRSLVSLGRE